MCERPALLRRKMEPDRLPFFDGEVGGRDGAYRLAVGEGHKVVPMRAQIDLPGDRAAGPVRRLARLLRHEADVVMPDRDGGVPLRGEGAGLPVQHDALAASDDVAVEALALEDVGAADEARYEFGARPLVDVLGAAGLLDAALVHDDD